MTAVMNALQAGEVSLCHFACEGTCIQDASDGPCATGQVTQGENKALCLPAPEGL